MGGGLGVVLRSTLRTGWRGLLGLALLIGLAGVAVLTGMEAARRTDSAFARLEAETNAWDVLVNPDDGTDSGLTFEQITALPMVEDAGRVEGVFMGPEQVDAFADLDDGFITFATDRVATYHIGRPVDLVTPAAAVVAVAVGVLLLANLVGLVPGLRAARAHTTSILRTE